MNINIEELIKLLPEGYQQACYETKAIERKRTVQTPECEEVKYALGAENLSNEELFTKFGEVTEYPYFGLPDGKLTKTLNVSVLCQAYYNSSIEVPDGLSREEALDYARKHLDSIPLGVLEYVADSNQLDEENCDFAE